MEKITPKSSEHVQTFSSTGTYSITKNSISLFTEIPKVELIDHGKNTYSLQHRGCYNISTPSITCMLNVYTHGHPTNREKLIPQIMEWDSQELTFTSVFEEGKSMTSKILVITVHDEDFEEWQKHVYRFFIQNHVSYDPIKEVYEIDIKVLQEFLNGTYINTSAEEEPRTVGGGVLDPA